VIVPRLPARIAAVCLPAARTRRSRFARPLRANSLADSAQPRRDFPLDLLDPTIVTKETIEEVRASSSPISQRWGMVASLQPQDFVDALRGGPCRSLGTSSARSTAAGCRPARDRARRGGLRRRRHLRGGNAHGEPLVGYVEYGIASNPFTYSDGSPASFSELRRAHVRAVGEVKHLCGGHRDEYRISTRALPWS
jgi:hypothetical protein